MCVYVTGALDGSGRHRHSITRVVSPRLVVRDPLSAAQAQDGVYGVPRAVAHAALGQAEAALHGVEALVQVHLLVEEQPHAIQSLQVLLVLRQRYRLVGHVDGGGGVGAAHLRSRTVGVGAVRRLSLVQSVLGHVHPARARERYCSV